MTGNELKNDLLSFLKIVDLALHFFPTNPRLAGVLSLLNTVANNDALMNFLATLIGDGTFLDFINKILAVFGNKTKLEILSYCQNG